MLAGMLALIRREGMLPPGSRVLCAVSGGADSVALLAGLYRLREQLDLTVYAAHYNHNLRGEESRRDEDFVRALVQKRFPDVKLYVGSGDVARRAKEQGAGLEETARAMRYTFLNETARIIGADKIATAHTADDNAETILLHLCRGTGLQGLTGIAPVRGALIRPMLCVTRSEVEAFLQAEGLPHVEDSSNRDEYYARNRVRRQVMPVLEGLYPGFARRVSENAAALRQDEDYLTRQGRELASRAVCTEDEVAIPAAVLAHAPKPVAVRAVRQLLSRLREGDDSCTAAHLEGMLELCRSQAPSGEMHLPGGMLAVREYELLKLTRASTPEEWQMELTPCVYEGQRPTPLEMWLSREKIPAVHVRTRQEGDTLKLPGRPTKKVKKWLVDEKIPRRERDALPVLTCGGKVAAVALLGADASVIPEPGEDSWHILFARRGEETGKEC